MHRLPKFLALAPADQRLLLAALGWTAAARIALWLLPFRALRILFARAVRRRPVAHSRPLPALLASADIAGRFIPHATCLTKALAAKVLLAGQGYDVSLRVGVRRAPSGQFQAHAWLERGGIVIYGLDEAQDYSLLPQF